MVVIRSHVWLPNPSLVHVHVILRGERGERGVKRRGVFVVVMMLLELRDIIASAFIEPMREEKYIFILSMVCRKCQGARGDMSIILST